MTFSRTYADVSDAQHSRVRLPETPAPVVAKLCPSRSIRTLASSLCNHVSFGVCSALSFHEQPTLVTTSSDRSMRLMIRSEMHLYILLSGA